jgi:hypothetical protein
MSGLSFRIEEITSRVSAGEAFKGWTESQPPLPPEAQEFAMKNLILAAIAALSLGIGSAYAHDTVVKNGVVLWGPSDTAGGAGG